MHVINHYTVLFVFLIFMLWAIYVSGKEDFICMEDGFRDAHSSIWPMFSFKCSFEEKRGKNLKELIDESKYRIKRISKQRSTFTNFLWQQGELQYQPVWTEVLFWLFCSLYRESASIPLQKAGTKINWLINNGVINMLITHFLHGITQVFRL